MPLHLHATADEATERNADRVTAGVMDDWLNLTLQSVRLAASDCRTPPAVILRRVLELVERG